MELAISRSAADDREPACACARGRHMVMRCTTDPSDGAAAGHKLVSH